jgi:hypothetical protein
MSLDEIYARTPDLASVDNAEPLAQMDLDGSSLFIKQETLQDGASREVMTSLLDKEKGNQGKPTGSKTRGRRSNRPMS